MRVLVIEDVQSKFDDVRSILNRLLPSDTEYVRASNLNEAEDAIMEDWSLVVVDLSMDINGNGSVQGAGHATLGGLDVLERMALLKIDHPTVLVTGFDSFQDTDRFDNAIMNLTDISGLASEWLGTAYVGCIRYGGDNWGRRFERMLQLWKSK